MSHLRSQLGKKKKQGIDKTGALWWSKMEAYFGDPDPANEALDLENAEEDVEQLEVYAHFSSLMPPAYNREPLTCWARTTKKCSRTECIICAHALKSSV